MKKLLGDILNTASLALENRGPTTPAMLRGGRMTKLKGEAASYSPDLGLTVLVNSAEDGAGKSVGRIASSALRWSCAPIAILASGFGMAAPAAAQDSCTTTGVDEVTCDDGGAPATTTQTAATGLGD